MTKPSASAVSRILNAAGFKKALPASSGWSSGYSVSQTVDSVLVYVEFTSSSSRVTAEDVVKMAKVLNSHPSGRYFAEIQTNHDLVVRLRDTTDPVQNEAAKAEALEELAAEHPAAPQIKDVKAALLNYSPYAFVPERQSGYLIERYEDDTRLVRVAWRETSFTTYGTHTNDEKERIIASTLANYWRVLVGAGFEVKPAEDDEWSLLVAMPGEWDNKLTPETVSAVLRSNYVADDMGGVADVHGESQSGYVVRSYRRDKGALRVEYYAHKGEQPTESVVRLLGYTRVLRKAGYEATPHSADSHAIVVRLADPAKAEETPAPEETHADVQEAIQTLRRAMKGNGRMYEAVRRELGF